MHITHIAAGKLPAPNVSQSIPTPEPVAVRTENAFADRLADAVVGEVIIYHVGHLARDRTRVISDLPEHHRVELNAIATRAMRLFLAGRVTLVQRRVDTDRCAYLAIVCKQPRRMQPPRAAIMSRAAGTDGEAA
jgi:hypothetical protein